MSKELTYREAFRADVIKFNEAASTVISFSRRTSQGVKIVEKIARQPKGFDRDSFRDGTDGNWLNLG